MTEIFPIDNAHCEMPGMDFSRVQHTQGNRRRTFKQNLRVTHSAKHGDTREAYSNFFLLQIHEHYVKEFSQIDTFVSELDVSPWNKLLQSETSELDVEKPPPNGLYRLKSSIYFGETVKVNLLESLITALAN